MADLTRIRRPSTSAETRNTIVRALQGGAEMEMFEAYDSPQFSGNKRADFLFDRVTLGWIVRGTDDADLAIAYAFPRVPIEAYGLIRKGLGGFSRLGLRAFRVDVEYAAATLNNQSPLEPGEVRFSFDTTGATARVTQSLDTDAYPADDEDAAPDHHGAIEVNHDGTVNGVEIPAPSLKFSLTYRAPVALLTLAYVDTIAQLTGSTNEDRWFGATAENLLFLGAKGDQTIVGDESSTITYDFERRWTVPTTTYGTGLSTLITVPPMPGHRYLWFFRTVSGDDNAHRRKAKPVAAYVEKVLPTADFRLLQIGT